MNYAMECVVKFAKYRRTWLCHQIYMRSLLCSFKSLLVLLYLYGPTVENFVISLSVVSVKNIWSTIPRLWQLSFFPPWLIGVSTGRLTQSSDGVLPTHRWWVPSIFAECPRWGLGRLSHPNLGSVDYWHMLYIIPPNSLTSSIGEQGL